jgi:hypothetical protein
MMREKYILGFLMAFFGLLGFLGVGGLALLACADAEMGEPP